MIFASDSRTIYYLADAEVNDRREIYQVTLPVLYLPVILR